MADQFSREQVLLIQLRDERCGGNAAELARKIKKDPTYVNRLLYPIGKRGRKGIGLEVMRAASVAFSLPPGFWEGADAPPSSFADAIKAEANQDPYRLIAQGLQALVIVGDDFNQVMKQVRELAAKSEVIQAAVLAKIKEADTNGAVAKKE